MKIERVELGDPESFARRYMDTLTPVVVTDLFAGEPIREVRGFEDALALWGEVPLLIQPEYLSASGGSAEETMSFERYLRFTEAHPDTTRMCIEYPTPAPIAGAYRVPPLCASVGDESEAFVNQMFLGNRGNVANVHFDKAGLFGFLYQVVGRKKFVIFPIEASRWLLPVTQIGAWRLGRFSPEDWRAFLELTGGEEVLLEPGEAIFVPALCWHFVSYVETSMSISLRFRRTRTTTRLLRCLFPDHYLQGIAYRLHDPGFLAEERERLLRRIEEAAAAPAEDGREKVARMRRLARELHERLYPERSSLPLALDPEEWIPPILPHFLDQDHPDRPRYE